MSIPSTNQTTVLQLYRYSQPLVFWPKEHADAGRQLWRWCHPQNDTVKRFTVEADWKSSWVVVAIEVACQIVSN